MTLTEKKYISDVSREKLINTVQRIELCMGQEAVHRVVLKEWNRVDFSRDMATEWSKRER